jgi:hypothetical protein
MTGPPSLAFPGSRTLAGWWRQLTPHRPQGLWIGHLGLHRVEALVALARAHAPDPGTRLVLKALSLAESAPGSSVSPLEHLDAHLHLGRQLLAQVLRTLAAEGLVQADRAEHWVLTPRGQQALAEGAYPQRTQERRTFHFLEGEGDPPGTGRSPPFVSVNNSTGVPVAAEEGWQFDLDLLRACLKQPAEWKQQRGFPLDVCAILDSRDSAGPVDAPADERTPPPLAWQRVVVDRPERLLVALTVTEFPEGKRGLLAFAVRQDGWVLNSAEPALSLAEGWHELFPELANELPLEVWRQAWRSWCQPRGVSLADAAACGLERQGERLRVTAPARLLEHLRATRSDALKGQAWLLAGEGRLRTAALIDLGEPPA